MSALSGSPTASHTCTGSRPAARSWTWTVSPSGSRLRNATRNAASIWAIKDRDLREGVREGALEVG